MEQNGELGEIQLETPDQRAVRIWGGYAGYKAELDHVVRGTAESMVRIGYMLRQARDTNILKESGYLDVWHFAHTEYGISKTQASRFMSASERYGDSEGKLKNEWMGRSKMELIELMSIPEDKAKEVPKGLSRKELRRGIKEIKRQKVEDALKSGKSYEEIKSMLEAMDEEGPEMIPEAQREPDQPDELHQDPGEPELAKSIQIVPEKQDEEPVDREEDAQPEGQQAEKPEGEQDKGPGEDQDVWDRSRMVRQHYLVLVNLLGKVMSKILDEKVDWDEIWEDVENIGTEKDSLVKEITKMRCADMMRRGGQKEE